MQNYSNYEYLGRHSEMAETLNRYSHSQPLVVSTPISINKVQSDIKNARKMSGGQGKVFLLKQYKEQICVKLFDLDETDKTYPYIMKKRAKNVQNALQILANMSRVDSKTVLLFNQLNIPRCYIEDPEDGKLRGLLIPTAPRSCYKSFNNFTEKQCVTLNYIVSRNDRFINPNREPNDQLTEIAKWSFLDSLCQAINSLHALHLIHADISSSNVFVRWADSSTPKAYVIDAFNGYSDVGGNKELKHMFSDVYCPISVLRCEYTPATDVYCLAWWIIHIVFGMDPEPIREARPGIRALKAKSSVVFSRHNYVVSNFPKARRVLPSNFFYTLLDCIHEDPEKRPTSGELFAVVHDYWMNLSEGDEYKMNIHD